MNHGSTIDDLDRQFSLKQALVASDSKLELLKEMTSNQLQKHFEIGVTSHISRQVFALLQGDERTAIEEIETDEASVAKHKKTTRLKFRQTMDVMIGPAPSVKGLWKEQGQWQALVSDMAQASYQETYDRHIEQYPHWSSAEAFIAKQIETGSYDRTLLAGYSQSEAEALCLLNSHGIKAALARAAESQSPRYCTVQQHDLLCLPKTTRSAS